jgi:hypothetical protein
VAGSPVAQAPAGPSASATPRPAQQAAVALELLDQSTWLHAGEQFTVTVRGDGAPADAALQLTVHDRLESRVEFQGTLEGELGGVELETPAVPLAEATTGTASAPAYTTGFVVGGPNGNGLEGRGVYPVEVQLVDGGGGVLASLLTHLTYLPEPNEFTPLAVAVVVDLTAPPALQPDGSVDVSAATEARARERATLLRDTPDVSLTFAPQPETLDGLADAGNETTVRTLAQATAARPVLARPYTDVDLAALQDAGLIAEANDQAEAGADVVRSRFGREPQPGVWLSGETLGSEAAGLAVQLGIERALVPPTAVEAPTGTAAGPVPDGPVSAGSTGLLAMVSDAELGAHLTADNGIIDAQRFLAELAMMWFERPSLARAVAVELPGDVPLVRDTVVRALNGLTDGQAVRAVTLDELFDTVPPVADDGSTTVEAVPHEITADLDGIAPQLERARDQVSGVAGTVGDVPGTETLGRSLLLATGSATPNDERAAYVGRVTDELSTLSGAVVLPEQFRITLTSRSSNIPVNITNTTDETLQVRIELESSQLEFPDGDVLTQELQPGATRLEVRVRSLTSGAFPLEITVTSPDGSIVFDRTTFDIRSTAVTGVGLVLSVGAGLFLAVWWARHWRRARRSRHLMPAGAVPAEPPPPGALDDAEGYRPAHMAGPRGRAG